MAFHWLDDTSRNSMKFVDRPITSPLGSEIRWNLGHWLHAAFLCTPPGAAGATEGAAAARKVDGGCDGDAEPSCHGCIVGGYDDDEIWLECW